MMTTDLDDIFSNLTWATQIARTMIHQQSGDCHSRDAARQIEQDGLLNAFWTQLEKKTGMTAYDF